MNPDKLKRKSFQGGSFTRQEKLIIDLFGSSPKRNSSSLRNSSSKSSSASRKSIISTTQKNSSPELITTNSRSPSSTKTSSSSLSTTSRTPSPNNRSSWLYKTHSPKTPTYHYSHPFSPTKQDPLKIIWRLIPIDLSSIKLTRPPLYHLHRWDRRAKRELSPRYKEDYKENYIFDKKLNSRERRKERRKLMFNKE